MKTIIHIGQHKTGTTSIQHFLQDNRVELGKRGLYVPAGIAGYTNPSHFILNVYALGAGRYSSMKEHIVATKGESYLDELEGKLKQDIEKIYADAARNACDRVIWSNEGLYLLNSIAEYERLKDLFAGVASDSEVVCCFRDVASYRASYIKQQRRQNFQPSDDPDSYRYLEPDSWLFDYERKKELLAGVFDQCTYFDYDATDNVKAFLDAIGCGAADTDGYRLNVSPEFE